MIDEDGDPYLRGRRYPIAIHFDAHDLFEEIEAQVAVAKEPETMAAVRLIEIMQRDAHEAAPDLVVRVEADEGRYPIPRAKGGDPGAWPPDVVHVLNVGFDTLGRLVDVAAAVKVLRRLLNRVKQRSDGGGTMAGFVASESRLHPVQSSRQS